MNNKQQTKFVVVDTSALIELPDVINRIDPATVFVPLTVIKQLDGLKTNPNTERSTKARSASFFIEEGIKSGRVTVLTQYDNVDGLDNLSDNKIVGAAVRLKKENPDAEVALLATDRNMRIVASGYGITAVIMKEKTKMTRTPLYCFILIALGIILFLLGVKVIPSESVGTFVIILGMGMIAFGLEWLRKYYNVALNRKECSRDNDIISQNLEFGITDTHKWKIF